MKTYLNEGNNNYYQLTIIGLTVYSYGMWCVITSCHVISLTCKNGAQCGSLFSALFTTCVWYKHTHCYYLHVMQVHVWSALLGYVHLYVYMYMYVLHYTCARTLYTYNVHVPFAGTTLYCKVHCYRHVCPGTSLDSHNKEMLLVYATVSTYTYNPKTYSASSGIPTLYM